MNKCPFPHLHSPIVGENTKDSNDHSHAIAQIFRELKSGVDIIIDTPEKEQSLFVYRIYQFAIDIGRLQSYMNSIIDTMRDDPDTYKNLANETRWFLEKFGRQFFQSIEKDSRRVEKLVGWLETFHAFIKRAVLFAEFDSSNKRIFPYAQAKQLASTAMWRANIMVVDPDIRWWEWLFFDPADDVSKRLLSIPAWRPVYRCPLLYSGKFREIIDMHFQIMCDIHSISIDKPSEVDWNTEDTLY
jgi:hypothetical protein